MIIALRSLRGNILAALSVIVLASAPGVCSAEVIDNFPGTAFLSALGEPFSPYFAQTFKALPGVVTDLAIELAGNLGPDDVDFHVLITEVSGSGLTFHPTVVLFESDTVTFSSAAPPTVVHIPLPNLALVPSKTYAFILDAFVTRDGSDGTALVATNGTYADGAFYFNQGFAGSSRTDHFADQWFFAESIYPPDFHDIAFQLSFAEPDISVGGTVTGVNPRRVVCKNLTTRKHVTILLDGVTAWDCEAAGLVVNPGDRIWQTVIGIAD